MKLRTRRLIVLEANIDDMNPQLYEEAMERLFEAGALDVVLIPVVMKKSRPGVILQVLAEPARRERLTRLLFTETTTLGVRFYPVSRLELTRESRKVKTPFGTVEVKVGRDRKGQVLNVAPEYESCRALARRTGRSLKEVWSVALRSTDRMR